MTGQKPRRRVGCRRARNLPQQLLEIDAADRPCFSAGVQEASASSAAGAQLALKQQPVAKPVLVSPAAAVRRAVDAAEHVGVRVVDEGFAQLPGRRCSEIRLRQKPHRRFGTRVPELKGRGVQVQAGGRGTPVKRVAENRQAFGRRVHPDLVGAPRDGLRLEPGCPPSRRTTRKWVSALSPSWPRVRG